MKTLALSFAVLAVACGASVGGERWRTVELERLANADLACPTDRLSTYEAGPHLYTVRGCGKRALYQLHSCNRVTRACHYSRKSDVGLAP